jgi:hypothetical protein
MAVAVVPLGELRCNAVVQAAETFTLSSIAPGRYQWTLRHGRTPGGQGLVRQRVLQFERSDLVEMELLEGITTGAEISQGQAVAALRSVHNRRQLEGLRAQRAALEARRALLVAGGPPEAVSQAVRGVELARAAREAERADLDRVRLLAEQGLVSAADLEVAELRDEVHRLEVEVARAAVEVARSPGQPEALAELDAQIAAVDVSIEELAQLLQEETVISPIDGVAELGVGTTELRVHRLDSVYLAMPIPEASRSQVRVGAPALFVTTAAPGKAFRGELVQLASSGSTVQGQPVFWASAEISNPEALLRPGTAGVAEVELGNRRWRLLRSFRRWLGRKTS